MNPSTQTQLRISLAMWPNDYSTAQTPLEPARRAAKALVMRYVRSVGSVSYRACFAITQTRCDDFAYNEPMHPSIHPAATTIPDLSQQEDRIIITVNRYALRCNATTPPLFFFPTCLVDRHG